MKKTDNATYSKQIIEIADYIFKNPTKKMQSVVALFCTKLHKSERTIKTYIKQAKEYNHTRLIKQEKAKDEVLVKQATKAAETAILNRNESLEILSKIAKGVSRKIGDEVMSPTDGERIRAIERLAKMEGWDVPQKTELTGKDGLPLNPEPLTIEIIDSRDRVLKKDDDTND